MRDVGGVSASRIWGGSDLLAAWAVLVRRWLALLLAIVAASAAVVTALTSRHLAHPGAEAVLQAESILGLSLAAALWLRRRPDERWGTCLAVYAGATAVASMEASNNSALYAVGVLGRVSLLPVATYCLLTFPSGNLRGPVRKGLVGFAVSVAVAILVPTAVLSSSVESGLPLGACSATCPENALRVASVSPDAIAALRWAGGAAAALTTVGVAAVLVRRFAAGTRPKRQAIGAVVAVGALAGSIFAVRWLATEADASVDVLDGLSWAYAILLGLLPAAFVTPILRAQIAAGSALEEMLSRLARRPDSRRWEADVGTALGDPALRLAFWSAQDQAYQGIDGLAIGAAGDRLEWHRIDRYGFPAVAILHDPELEADPDLLRAAGTATLLSLEGQRLSGEIRAARSRILAAAEEERRRLERDLHDGAQQHLISLRVKVALVANIDPREARRVVAEMADDVDAALDELRGLAQGIYPTLLRAEGLVGALHAVARRSSIPAAVHTTGLGRYPVQVESPIYFCCLEALQNAAKHSGADACATIRLAAVDGSLRFRVEDTGVGFDARSQGTGIGISSMSERMAAIGGHLRIVSQPGCGTVVTGWIPFDQM